MSCFLRISPGVPVLLALWCAPVAAQTWSGSSASSQWSQPDDGRSEPGSGGIRSPGANRHAAAKTDPFSPSRFDAAFGMGVAVGVGLNPVPRSPLIMAAADGTWWFSQRWGLALDYMRARGEAERDGFGERDVQLASLRLRFRAPVQPLGAVVVGIGLGFTGWELFGPGTRGDYLWAGGLSGEAYLQRSLTERVAVRGGVSIDTNEDTIIARPAILAVLSF